MHSWRRSAAYRIAFANVGVLLLGLALLGALVFMAMHIAFTRQLDAMISDETRTLVDEYHADGPREMGEAIAEREASRSAQRLMYAVFAPDGRRIYGRLQATRPPLGLHDLRFIDPREGPDAGRGLAVDLSPHERLLVAADREWIEQIDRTLLEMFGAAFVAACLLGFVSALVLARYLQRRLRSISQTAEAIIGGDIRERMPVSDRRDEFDQLALTLNRMLDRIEGLVENLREVSSDIAHDLRTPLAQLRNRLEAGALLPDRGAAAEIIADAIQRVDEVLSLFAAILRIAEVESGESRRRFVPVDLSALALELAESYAPAVHDGGRILLWSIEPGLKVRGDRELIAQAGVNLLENAQRHTPKGTAIRLTLTAVAQLVCLRVIDNGPGVPRSELGRVVKRFARLEQSRTTPGYGLGLNLVSAVAKLHGGTLLLKSDGGFSATVELPRSPELDGAAAGTSDSGESLHEH
jgi:signal transduction histidine kinase